MENLKHYAMPGLIDLLIYHTTVYTALFAANIHNRLFERTKIRIQEIQDEINSRTGSRVSSRSQLSAR
jgi:hypothetical protein